ncbi:MAG: hypothetical protein AAF184_20175 [Pseudomonadota bacterium]
MDRAYFAVRPDLVLLAKELFDVRPSALEAGEKRLLLTAQAIASGRRTDRWGHHTQAVIARFCAATAAAGQPALPWQELLEDTQCYDGVEGVSSRTGNRPLGTTTRYLVDARRLSGALAAAGASPAHLAKTGSWPEAFVQALVEERWPSVSEETARHLQAEVAPEVVAPMAPAHESMQVQVSPENSTKRYLPSILALSAVLGLGALLGWRGPVPAPPVEVVGYWDYDEIDGEYLVHGLRLLDAPGAAVGARWQRRLELVEHDALRPRARQLWPVELRPNTRRVCINYPGYPTYAAFIDASEDEEDGIYRLGPCE